MDRKLWALALIALAGLILACGSTATPSGGATNAPASGGTSQPATAPATAPTEAPPAASGPGKVGDRIEQAGTALTVVKVEKKTEIGTIQKAKAGRTYVLAEVLIENTGTEKLSYNLFYFKIKDSEGFEENATLYTGDGAFHSGDLAAGEKVRGIVAFEVKETATGLVLSYKPITFGKIEPIRVALE